jgi:hypothetical protein
MAGRKKVVLSPEIIERARALKLSGMTIREVSEQLGKNYNTIKQALRGLNWSWLEERNEVCPFPSGPWPSKPRRRLARENRRPVTRE